MIAGCVPPWPSFSCMSDFRPVWPSYRKHRRTVLSNRRMVRQVVVIRTVALNDAAERRRDRIAPAAESTGQIKDRLLQRNEA